MITKEIFPDVLECLGFEKEEEIFKKDFPNLGTCTMSADFKNKKLYYPENLGFTINDRTTCNFEHPENFVVFECVHRLLEKGYRPEHIELEKRWNLGHDAKGGKADICVYDETGKNMLLIIECKTAGGEHAKALKLLKEDGGQLFSYWQQERSTKWLSLYASDFKEGELTFENYVIDCSDDENVKKLAAKDKSIKLYEKAQTVKDLFDVWDETYDKIIFEKGVVFGEESQAYQIGVPPLRKKNLEDFKPEDKIVNRFEEILRHNNVSDKENAFNRLVALFICKLVDETQKTDNDVVEFQYKTGTDTYESLQDRLQRLHKEGMEKFMGEEIFYVSDDYAENLFAQKFNDNRRKAAIEDLKKTIRILKFYSNNDFAFKDVHNEELFFQNGKILVEVVQLFQKYRIVYPSKHQFLGDLFEQLLNKGFKQNEGQFFTPMPITRFIWDCLPMDKIVRKGENFAFPKVIDYACGAGHFLTEAVEAINAYFTANDNADAIRENAWCEHHIYGVEKDYRLARVAKVSLYMNGAGQGNIKFGDGLEQYEEEKICNYSFDVLVANPPYSVSGFKAHLKLKNNRFELLERNLISNDGSEIETLFVERIAQLLKPKGIAAVVLPSSILSNDSNSYMTAREILLQNFYLRAIAQFGSKTFGATGTNTVVLFLEKYNEPPKKCEMVKDIVNAILSGNFADDWEDADVFKNYTQKIGAPEDLYRAFAKETATKDDLGSNEYFAQYISWFDNLTEVTNKQKSNKFKKLGEAEQQKEIREWFFKLVKEVEREKLIYFALVYKQSTLTIIAPADNAEQKKFLGYDWSNRKGAEGIQINQSGGMLYNDSNRYDNDTLAAAVRNSFNDRTILLQNTLEKYHAYLRTQDMLDFSRTTFNKAIKLTADKKIEIVSKYPLKRLEDIVVKVEGSQTKIAKEDIQSEGIIPVITQETGNLIAGYTDNVQTINDLPLIVFGDHSCTFKYVDFEFVRGADGTQLIKIDNQYNTKYVYEFLCSIEVENSGKYERHFKYLKSTKIPLPPIDIQQQIVSECEKVDEEYNNSRMSIEGYKKKIETEINGVEGQKKSIRSLCSVINPSKSAIRDIPNDTDVSFVDMPSISNDGFIEVKTDKPLGELRKGSYTYFAENDIIIAKITPCMENGKCAIAKDLTNGIGMGSSEFHVFRCDTSKINTEFMFAFLNRDVVRKEAEKRMTGASGHRRVPISFYENMEIPVPTLADQQRIVSEIESYEAEIAKAKAVMAGCAERKKQILEKWLR
ncbi:MAG: N-6 DNA methylase [Bacteroidales bacterium]|nr:N-6 DNA methylase [Bacteroidales bacterium]